MMFPATSTWVYVYPDSVSFIYIKKTALHTTSGTTQSCISCVCLPYSVQLRNKLFNFILLSPSGQTSASSAWITSVTEWSPMLFHFAHHQINNRVYTVNTSYYARNGPVSAQFWQITACLQVFFLINATEWVSEWLSLTAFLGTGDIGVHVVHINRCNHSIYIGIIIFPHINNTQSTGHNKL